MHVDHVDWRGIRDRIFGRIDPIATGGQAYREGPECPNITVYYGIGPGSSATSTLDTGTGSDRHRRPVRDGRRGRARSPTSLASSSGARIHTSDTIMRIDELPRSIIILGGGFVAAEFAHVFASFGVRGHPGRARRPAAAAPRRRHRRRVHGGGASALDAADPDLRPPGPRRTPTASRWSSAGASVSADLVLVATGRRPNSDRLEVEATGVDVDDGPASSSSTSSSGRPSTGSSPSATSVRPGSSSTSPTTR